MPAIGWPATRGPRYVADGRGAAQWHHAIAPSPRGGSRCTPRLHRPSVASGARVGHRTRREARAMNHGDRKAPPRGAVVGLATIASLVVIAFRPSPLTAIAADQPPEAHDFKNETATTE